MLDAIRLRVLVAIARHGSVIAAAQALNYAQPSISHHMARLESETGAKLMERAGRGIRLTEAGQLLAERAEEILGRLDAAEAELAAHVGLKQEKVRLAAFGSALGTLAAAAVPALRADRAVTDVSLVQAEPADALRMLRVGEVDVALVFRYRHSVAPANEDAGPGTPSTSAADPLSDEDLRFQAVLDEPVYLITPATWPGGTGGGGPAAGPGGTGGGGPAAGPGKILNAGRAGHQHGSGQHGSGQPRSGQYGSGRRGAGKPASTSAAAASILAAYEGHRWIAGCERCQDVLLRLCRSAGFSPDIAVTTDDYIAAQALVTAGLGIAVLPGLALRALRHPGVTATELPGIRRQVLAATYGGPPEPLAAGALLAALTRAANRLGHNPLTEPTAGTAAPLRHAEHPHPTSPRHAEPDGSGDSSGSTG